MQETIIDKSTCIYCLKDSSASKSRPHIIPECFLANNVTLPIGAECDNCNLAASQLEKAFLHHNRIWVPIMILGALGKGGRLTHTSDVPTFLSENFLERY